MNKKTIWYCHHYAGSPSLGMSYRPYYFTREFANAGHNAFIISADHHHLLQKNSQQIAPIVLNEIDGVQFIQLKTKPYRGNGLGRILNMLSYAARIQWHTKELVALTGKPDVIIVSCSHLFHYPVLERIAKRYGAKLIFEVRDLWPLSLIDLLKVNPLNPLILWLAQIERRAYRRANHVVSLLDTALPYMESKGLSREKFHVIPNGASVELFRACPELSERVSCKIAKLREQGLFLLGYAGALGSPNAMQYLVSAMAILAEQNAPIHCVIVGEGTHKEQLEHAAMCLELTNMSFLPAIPKYEIPAFLSQMDALYLGWNDAEIYKYGVSPNKVFDYMMAKRPIIESGGSTKGVINSFGCGIQCAASNPNTIAESILAMSNMSVDERNAMGALGGKAVEEIYDYKILAQRFLALFEERHPVSNK